MARTNPKILYNLDDTALFALCLYGEARGEPAEGRQAVAGVIMNRVRAGGWYGSTVRDVILKPRQFSCFNAGDPNRTRLAAIASSWIESLKKDQDLQECHRMAKAAIGGDLPDIVNGATHYKAVKCRASWTSSMIKVAVIGRHEFYIQKRGARS